MRVLGLISGGKDSCYNMVLCVAAGHEIVALGHLKPEGSCELDSFMIQSVGSDAVPLMAEAMDLPLAQVDCKGLALRKDMQYEFTPGDEVEDLYSLLSKAKDEFGVEAVASGAIASNYQRIRVEHACQRLGLVSLAYLWKRDQTELLREMAECGVKATVIKIAALGLKKDHHLGKEVTEIIPQLKNLEERFGLNVCGEGGEYETFTTDCPLYKKRIVLDETETVRHSEDAFAPVAYVQIRKAHLEPKQELRLPHMSQKELVDACNVKRPQDHVQNSKAYPVDSGAHAAKDGWVWLPGVSGRGDPERATEHVMTAMQENLEVRGLSWSNVVATELYVASMRDYEAINRAYKSRFGANPPCRVCVQCPLQGDVALAMQCVAHRHGPKSVLHVQSVSSWAPANIGPYSQAVKVGDYIHVAGQIGLVAATMVPVGGGEAQAELSLRHVRSIVTETGPNLDLDNVLYGVCFVTDKDLIPAAEKLSDENALTGRVLFAVVPALPRATSVEWQFVFHQRPLYRWAVAEKEESLPGGCNLSFRKFTSGFGETLVIAKVWAREGGPDDAQGAIEESLRSLSETLRGAEEVRYKILYDTGNCAEESVQRAWAAVFGSGTCGSTFFAIPTSGLGFANSLLGVAAESRVPAAIPRHDVSV